MVKLPSQINPTASNKLLIVNLKFDDRLQPTPLQEFRKKSPPQIPAKSVLNVLRDGPSSAKLSHAVGSAKNDELLHFRYASFGLFGAVYEAWLNHWALCTTPEDWWFPVALKIAKAVDKQPSMGTVLRIS
ncbi:unnamed protein product [Cylindrotheca closterium]|uniref:Uncharacterized protein n=1 Tax=Cylindrotheca closterium TaxID=2856 RepID=A0AAD2CN37_9STRA|nr:unnamed protein product [Cylindrotheca closterium]